jgi:hypothetical protein
MTSPFLKDTYGKLNDDFSVTVVDFDPLRTGLGLEDPRRQIAETFVTPDVRVSTVFLVINHGFGGTRNLWFETMIFGLDNEHQYQTRYETVSQARAGHARACWHAQRQLKLKTNA